MGKRNLKGFVSNSGFRRYERGELAKEILLMIAAGMAIPAAILMPNIPIVFKPLLKLLMKKSGLKKRHNFIRSMVYLKRNSLLSVAEREGQQILTLTEDGRKMVLKFHADQMIIRKPKKWDGNWRIVIFDIPEAGKQGREALRNKLKELGFFRLQKSCFVHPFDCKAEIDFICGFFEVSPYVNFIVAKEIEGQEKLQRFFDLC